MTETDANTRAQKLKHQFWSALGSSPYVFLQLDSAPSTAVPMTAALDTDANSAIWFFTSRDNALAKGGPATATFVAKGHDLFARFTGVLSEETSRARLEEEWNNFVEAYFPGGKDDPNLIMLRMDLGEAEIWNADVGIGTMIRMALGRDVREETRDDHIETTL